MRNFADRYPQAFSRLDERSCRFLVAASPQRQRRLMKPWVRLIGAAILIAIICLAFVAPGLAALSVPPSSTQLSSEFVAFAQNDPATALATTTKMLNVDPAATDLPRIFFGMSYGHASQKDVALQTPDLQTRSLHSQPIDQTGLTKDPAGVSVVLSGAIAESLQSCDDLSVRVTRNLSYEDLSTAEQRGAVVSLTSISNTAGSPSESQPAPNLQADQLTQTPADQASALKYTVLQPSVFKAYRWSWNLTKDSGDRYYDGYFASFTCTFAKVGLWQPGAGFNAFDYPMQTAVSPGDGTSASVVSDWRSVESVDPVLDRLTQAQGDAVTQASGNLQYSSSLQSWDVQRPEVSTQPLALQYVDSAGQATRELQIFVGGIAITVAGALGISFFKTLAVEITELYEKRKSRLSKLNDSKAD
ncbi:hypothetical protein KPL76_07115 [Subtercola sp. PAMC28395]|uniref:hypothetical protein n=1 Tax=Subtercola sp. PAMC28395 TaxID=2846775 RepID=UPI001C0E3BF2|nr:hypothetical protein [Subtercola sp. PAMC28395]QWT25106.1 hypothetical protein KPL76_07115 [Subtercola sp. PAMC28395]